MRIFTQYTDTKFINSLADIAHPDINIASANVQQNLYRIHYMYKFDAYIFCANLVNNEIYQFINEFANENTKFIIYHNDATTFPTIDSFPKKCINISGVSDRSDVISIPYLVNDHIFMQFNNTRNNDVLCFLDNCTQLPDKISSVVYPHTKLPIKLFSKHIKHPQNLGIVNDKEKAMLLNSSKYYISCDSGYEIEAMLCGATLVGIQNKEIHPTKIDQMMSYQTYKDFILSIL